MGVTKGNADWQFIGDKDEIYDLFHKKGSSANGVSRIVWSGDQGRLLRRLRRMYFSAAEVSAIADTASMTVYEVERFFKPLTKKARSYLVKPKAEPKVEPPKPTMGVKRISNGYQCTFMAGGQIHEAYGDTEISAKLAAEKRRKEIEAKPEEAPPKEKKGDRLSVTISGDEAMVLLNQLMIDFRHNAVIEEDKPVIQSIFLRLSTQII